MGTTEVSVARATKLVLAVPGRSADSGIFGQPAVARGRAVARENAGVKQDTLGKQWAVNGKTGGDDGGAELDIAPNKSEN